MISLYYADLHILKCSHKQVENTLALKKMCFPDQPEHLETRSISIELIKVRYYITRIV